VSCALPATPSTFQISEIGKLESINTVTRWVAPSRLATPLKAEQVPDPPRIQLVDDMTAHPLKGDDGRLSSLLRQRRRRN
jgi:hypothetical protein